MISNNDIKVLDAILSEAKNPDSELHKWLQENKMFEKLKNHDSSELGSLELYFADIEEELEFLSYAVRELAGSINSSSSNIIAQMQFNNRRQRQLW